MDKTFGEDTFQEEDCNNEKYVVELHSKNGTWVAVALADLKMQIVKLWSVTNRNCETLKRNKHKLELSATWAAVTLRNWHISLHPWNWHTFTHTLLQRHCHGHWASCSFNIISRSSWGIKNTKVLQFHDLAGSGTTETWNQLSKWTLMKHL